MTEKWNRRTFLATCVLGVPSAIYCSMKIFDYISILSKKESVPVRLAADFEAAFTDNVKSADVTFSVSSGSPTASFKPIASTAD